MKWKRALDQLELAATLSLLKKEWSPAQICQSFRQRRQCTPAEHRCSWSLVVASQCSLLDWLLVAPLRQALLGLPCLWWFLVLVRRRLCSGLAPALMRWVRLHLLGWHHLQKASRSSATFCEGSCLRLSSHVSKCIQACLQTGAELHVRQSSSPADEGEELGLVVSRGSGSVSPTFCKPFGGRLGLAGVLVAGAGDMPPEGAPAAAGLLVPGAVPGKAFCAGEGLAPGDGTLPGPALGDGDAGLDGVPAGEGGAREAAPDSAGEPGAAAGKGTVAGAAGTPGQRPQVVWQ